LPQGLRFASSDKCSEFGMLLERGARFGFNRNVIRAG
jgi:hypothetical protein